MLELNGQAGGESLTVDIKGVGTYEVPLASAIPVRKALEMRRVAQANDADATLAFMVDYLSEYLGDALDRITLDDLSQIMLAWTEASGVGMGES